MTLRNGLTLLIAVIVSTLTATEVSAQLVFEEDFSKKENEWKSVVGTWEIKDGNYVGVGAGSHNYGELQDPAFRDDLTYELTVTPDEGELQASGFGIWHNDQNYYILWICGLTNTADLLRVSIDGTKFDWDTEPDSCKIPRVRDGGDYRLKMAVKGDTITTYVNEEKVHELQVDGVSDMEGKFRCTHWGATTVAFDDLLVYGPKGLAVQSSDKLAVNWGQLKLGRLDGE